MMYAAVKESMQLASALCMASDSPDAENACLRTRHAKEEQIVVPTAALTVSVSKTGIPVTSVNISFKLFSFSDWQRFA